MSAHQGACQTAGGHSLQLQAHRLSGLHECSRFCCFEPLFGNVFRCQSSGITHVCDQTCGQRIPFNNRYDSCRFSKRLFPKHTQAQALSRKRSLHQDHDEIKSKRVNVMHSWASAPVSMDLDCRGGELWLE